MQGIQPIAKNQHIGTALSKNKIQDPQWHGRKIEPIDPFDHPIFPMVAITAAFAVITFIGGIGLSNSKDYDSKQWGECALIVSVSFGILATYMWLSRI